MILKQRAMILATLTPAAQSFSTLHWQQQRPAAASVAAGNRLSIPLRFPPPPAPLSSSALWMSSESNNDDDWYSDFDPSKDYTGGRQEQPRFRQDSGGSYNRGGGGRGGRGRGGGRGGGGSYNRGGGGSGPYQRDTSRDESNVDVAAVEALLQQRVDARFDRDYDLADSIREQLMDDHGVAVYDRDRTWRTGASRGGSGNRGRRDNNNRGGGGGERFDRDFGAIGHDYTLSANAGPSTTDLETDEINELLADRLRHKLSRNFQEADVIQEYLLGHGVTVHDGFKEWRADGELFGPPSNRNNSYVESRYSNSGDLDEEQRQTINDLVEQRSNAKATRDYDLADRIRDELSSDFNVFVDDKQKEWSIKGSTRLGSTGDESYSRSGDEPLDAEEEELIASLVEERAEARRNGDFDLADSIRATLKVSHQAIVNDKFRYWALIDNNRQGNNNRQDDIVWEATGILDSLTPEDMAEVEQMVQARLDARLVRNYQLADTIRDEMYDKFRVKVNDKGRQWYVVLETYQMDPNVPTDVLSPEDREHIQREVVARQQCKEQARYDEADTIRDRLADEYDVHIDDRTRLWKLRSLPDHSYGQNRNAQFGEYNTPDAEEDLDAAKESFGMVEDGDDDEEEEDYDSDLEVSSELDDDEEEEADDDDSDLETSGEFDEEDEEEEEEESTSSELEMLEADLAKLTISQLKEKLKEAGLPVSGRKAELIERLQEGSP